MLIRVIDFETTGLPPEAGIMEIGWTDVHYNVETRGGEQCLDISVGEWKNELTDPGRPVEIAARAIHHISDDDVKGCRKPETVLGELAEGVDFFTAHNAKFEKEFFPTVDLSSEVSWICTYKAALRLCPKSPNHQNQTIRYFLNTPCDPALAMHTHRAGPDSYVTAHTLAKFIEKIPPEVLSKWEKEPPVFPYCPIGSKERGKPWAEVDRGFLAWCTRQPSMDPDILWNVKRELDRRDGKL